MGLWTRIVELLAPGDAAERAKRRHLKAIAREVSRDRGGYYDPGRGTAGPGLGKLLHTFYRALGPAQTLLEAAGSSETLRNMVIESCLSTEELALRDGLTADAISRDAQTLDTRRFADKVREDIARFAALFDPARTTLVNERMRAFWALLDLISFDYYAVLKRMDPALPKSDYVYEPRFSPVDAALVIPSLKDFLEILPGVDTQADWDSLFDVLREYRHVDPVSRDTWRKLLRSIERLARSGVLMNVVRLMDQDPHANVEPRQYLRRSAEEYVERIRVQAEMACQKQLAQKRTAQVDEMVRKTFGKPPEQRMTSYVPSANAGFQKRGAAGYTHALPLNYLRVYLDEFLEREVKPLIDLVLVKGRWGSGGSSHPLSENLQAALQLRLDLVELDDSLAEDGPRGQRVKLALSKAGRNKKDAYILRQALRQVNDSARVLLETGLKALVSLGRVLKSLLDDLVSGEPRIVANWRELDTALERQLKARFVASYTRLYNLVQLLGQYRDVRTEE